MRLLLRNELCATQTSCLGASPDHTDIIHLLHVHNRVLKAALGLQGQLCKCEGIVGHHLHCCNIWPGVLYDLVLPVEAGITGRRQGVCTSRGDQDDLTEQTE